MAVTGFMVFFAFIFHCGLYLTDVEVARRQRGKRIFIFDN